ncbi:MAG TPA: alpha/beta hydrolase [Actinomycetota bacterium]|nr:alpha/beta hydrolase [Actinomycetota bacterium]
MNEARYREAERRLWDSVGVTPSERRVFLKRARATVRIQEVGEGEPIVFLAGVSNGGSSWADLVARLEGFRCVIVDKPGTGLSDRFPDRFTFETLAAFADGHVSDILDAVGLERAHVVSTSYGGYAALRSAAASPERIDRIVEFGWLTGAPTAKMPLFMRVATIPALSRLMTSMPAPESAVRSMFKQIGLREALAAGRISQEAIDWYRSQLNDTDTMRNEMDAGPRVITLKGMDEQIYLSDDLLASIQTPIYFLWGENDPFGGADIARAFAAKLPNAELELLPGAGHAVWLDDPDKAAEVTKSFLSDRAPAR